ncbi:ATP-binding protein [Thalassococcus sp. BH17M4-6]|uniref:ATP-binding protein n=1 Tax=Thalassococcus sp. BH17M4-6 TaxID=3413148 RepID=UPI003BBDD499
MPAQVRRVTARAPGTDAAHLRLHLPGTADAVRDALAQCVSWLMDAGVRDGACGTIELVVAESLNNVVEHAYGGTGRGDIGLDLRLLPGGGVEVRIDDHGQPMPQGALPDRGPPDLAVPRGDLPEGGFGWCLIRTLSSRLVYVRKNGRNRLFVRLDADRLG